MDESTVSLGLFKQLIQHPSFTEKNARLMSTKCKTLDDVINLINAADHALIEVGDDFGFNSDIEFFQDSKFFSPSQGTDQ